MIQDVVDNYKLADMNLEVIYLDIPYMNNFADFSVDTANFPSLKNFTIDLHSHDQKIVPIIDAAISVEDLSSPYYIAGNKKDLFIKSALYANSSKYSGNLVSEVWPKQAVFMDWLNNECQDVWGQGLKDLYEIFPYDGLWLDMNEPSAFRNGELSQDIPSTQSISD
jgi:alpha-glucosidase